MTVPPDEASTRVVTESSLDRRSTRRLGSGTSEQRLDP